MTKDKMIYNDDNTIGIDEQSLNKFDLLFNHNNLADELNNSIPPAVSPYDN